LTGASRSLVSGRPPSDADSSSSRRYRFIAQAEHLAETHLQGLDPTLDLAERELASVTTLDLDFDTIAAASGFVKQTIAAISRDPGASLFADTALAVTS